MSSTNTLCFPFKVTLLRWKKYDFFNIHTKRYATISTSTFNTQHWRTNVKTRETTKNFLSVLTCDGQCPEIFSLPTIYRWNMSKLGLGHSYKGRQSWATKHHEGKKKAKSKWPLSTKVTEVNDSFLPSEVSQMQCGETIQEEGRFPPGGMFISLGFFFLLGG